MITQSHKNILQQPVCELTPITCCVWKRYKKSVKGKFACYPGTWVRPLLEHCGSLKLLAWELSSIDYHEIRTSSQFAAVLSGGGMT